MKAKRWIKVWVVIISSIPIVGAFNYLIDPYGLYNTKYFSFDKIKQADKIRLIKAIKTQELKPASICLGNSRAEGAYDPGHKYFTKPSYNLATGGGTLYESKMYLELALKQNMLRKVLLVIDYRMFNDMRQKNISDFETYFTNINKYKYIFALGTLEDSFLTLIGNSNVDCLYNENGQRQHDWGQRHCDKKAGGHREYFDNLTGYYKDYLTNYTYKDTKEKTFLDFEKILELCYINNIELDIIFGPSHIKQWEILGYHLGYNKWLKWKKDVILSVNQIAQQHNTKQFKIMDFSVYHQLTAEKVPTDKNAKMKYYWESSHYKNELGLIVLDRLVGDSKYKDFGVELNLQNIDEHLKQQLFKRKHYIDTDKYQLKAFSKIKSI